MDSPNRAESFMTTDRELRRPFTVLGGAMNYESIFAAGLSFAEFVGSANANAELWREFSERAPLDDELAARIRESGGPWCLLVLADDWCGDAVNTLPVINRLVEAVPNAELRIVPRDAHPEIRDRHLTNGSRSIPIVILLDPGGVPLGWWGPRPTRLQALFERVLRSLPGKERYRELRKWYARDRGASTAREIAELFERGANAATSLPAYIPGQGGP